MYLLFLLLLFFRLKKSEFYIRIDMTDVTFLCDNFGYVPH